MNSQTTIAKVLLLGFLFVFFTPTFAQTYEYAVYIDGDNNRNTGCTVNTASAVTVSGMETRLQATVDGTTLQVTGVARSGCQGGNFGTDTLVGGPFAVGLNNGESGSDVIELSDEVSSLDVSSAGRLRFTVVASQGEADDMLDGKDGGFFLNLPVIAVPTLSTMGILILILALALIGMGLKRRNPNLGKITMVVLFIGCGMAWAVNFISDGLVGDWIGEEAIGTDAAGDATNGSNAIDIRYLFAAQESGFLYFRIDVADIENNSPVANAVNVTYLEDAAPQTINLSATDQDADPLTFKTTSAPTRGVLGAVVAVDASSATVNYTLTENEFGADSFSYVANDGQTDSAAAGVNITITPVNDAPGFTASDPPSVAEDAGAQMIAGWATVSPGPENESAQITSFTVTGNTNPDLFSVPPGITATGDLSYTPADNENGSATITITLSDDGGTANGGVDTSAPQAFVINVTPVNDQPSLTAVNPPAVDEDAGAQTIAGWATFSPGPANESAQSVIAYNVAAISNGALFSAPPAVANNGTLTYTPAAGVNGTSTFSLAVQDNGGTENGGVDTSATQMFTITVNSVESVNSAPGFVKGADQIVPEDSGPQTVVAWATDISPGPADESAQITSFTVTGNTNPDLFSVPPGITATGDLSYTPADNENGSATITITLSDDGGTANGGVDTSAPQAFVINVTPVNDQPSLTAVNPPAVDEDAGAQTIAGWATFSPGPANESAQSVIAYNVAAISNGALFSAPPAVANNGTLTYTPAAGVNGTSTFSLAVQDNGGTENGGVDTSATQMFTITVNSVESVNSAPGFVKGADQIVPEDSGPQTVVAWATDISPGPADESAQITSFTVTGNTNPGLFSVPPGITATGDLSYTPADNENGSATITIILSDDGGTANGGVDTSAPQAFVINVTPVNDPPTALAKDAGMVQANMPRVGIDANLIAGVTDLDTDVNGCTPVFSVGSISDGSNGTVSNIDLGAGTFDFTPAPGFTGIATVNYTVSDNGCPGSASSAPATISLTVISPVVWFVDDSAAGGGNGTLGNAFQTVGEATTAIGANMSQHIFIYDGNYTDGASLNENSRLIGQGLSSGTFDNVFGLAPPPGTATRPGLAGTRPQLGNTVRMHNNTQVRGLDIVSSINTGITATDRNGLFVDEVSVTGTTGTAVDLDNSDGTFSFTSVSVDGALNGINLNSSTGSFSVTGVGNTAASGGTIQNTTSDGIFLNGAMGTFTFTNLNIASSSGTSFGVSGGNSVIAFNQGSISQTGAGGAIDISAHTGSFTLPVSSTISATGGNGLQFDNADGTYNFQGAVTLNGGDAGIDILNGSAGTFTFPQTSITYGGLSEGINISSHTGTFTFGALSSLNATSGTGLRLDNADGTYDFSGSITLNGGDAGIDILNGSSSTFTFSDTTTITNPTGPSVNIENLEAPGTVNYNGSIVANNNVLVSINTTAPGTAINFNKVGGNTLTSTGNPNGGMFLFDLDGDLTMTTPTTILNPTFSSVFATDGDGTWSFTDLTITGQSGLNGGIDVFGNTGTVNFTNVNITTNSAGTGDAVTGFLAGGNNIINVNGSSSVNADGGGALVLTNINEINMTFQSLTSTNNLNSQIGFAGDDGIDLLTVDAGTLNVTGTTTVTSADGVGISIENSGATFTFADIDIDTIGDNAIISGVAFNNPGSVTVNGGSIMNTGSTGLRIGSGFGATGATAFEINNVTFTSIGGPTATVANSGLSGSGNTSAVFSCTDAGGNTGFISFNGGADTCP